MKDLKLAVNTTPILEAFTEKFNEIHPDFRNEPEVKPQLVQRANELEECLWDAGDENSEAAVESLQLLSNNGT